MCKIYVVDSIMGSGKAQPLDSLLLSEDGFIEMRDITVGTKLYGEDGNLHTVIGVYPQGIKDVYKIFFSDDSSVECCKEHLWTYQKPQDKLKNKYRTESLEEIMKQPLYKETNRNDKNWQIFVPLTNPINFKKKDIPLDPYLLGFLLGDGHLGKDRKSSISISCAEEDTLEKINKILLNYSCELKYNTKYDYRIKPIQYKPYNKNIIKEKLKELNLFGTTSRNKFIPNEYLYNSIDTRIALMQGLIDSDGNVESNGYNFYTISYDLAKNVQFIIQSLGGTCKITEKHTKYKYNGKVKNGKISYVCHIKINNIKLHTASKHNNKLSKTTVSPKRTIKLIDYIGKKECQCILVDNPSHLYLTNDFIVTHNTSAAINRMNEDTDNHYIFITPYLDEVQRIITNCNKRYFVQPEHRGKGKLDSLHYLLGSKYNIASTHALFQHYNSYTKDLLQEGNYILILDEVCQVVEIVNLSKSDLDNILKSHAHIDDNLLIWDDEDYTGRYDDIKNMALNKSLVVFGDSLIMWNFPVEIFKSFKEAYILTYMFKAQQQKYYYDYYNVKYEYLGVNNDNGYYSFSKDFTVPQYIYSLKDKINILQDDKLNSIGDSYYSLSSSWFEREQKQKHKSKFLLKALKNNMINYFTNKLKSPSEDNMWTTFKDYKKYLSGKGYTKGFVSVNARATNEFRYKNNLAYCSNIFLNPIIKQFFQTKDIAIYEEEYALSELVQWIWRSAIRDNKPINIYIPSSRMRNLLINWLEELKHATNK